MHIILSSNVEKNVIIECPPNCLKTLTFQNVPSFMCPVKLEESMAGHKPHQATLYTPHQQQENSTFQTLPKRKKKRTFSPSLHQLCFSLSSLHEERYLILSFRFILLTSSLQPLPCEASHLIFLDHCSFMSSLQLTIMTCHNFSNTV